jgi:uncharacterized lipoprotein YmbA
MPSFQIWAGYLSTRNSTPIDRNFHRHRRGFVSVRNEKISYKSSTDVQKLDARIMNKIQREEMSLLLKQKASCNMRREFKLELQ